MSVTVFHEYSVRNTLKITMEADRVGKESILHESSYCFSSCVKLLLSSPIETRELRIYFI